MPPPSIPKTIREKLEELRKRLERYEAAQRGEITYRRIHVKAFTVQEHEVSAHYRIIPNITPKKKKR